MGIESKHTVGWVDVLRIMACFLVVFAHCCDPFVARFDSDRSAFLQGCALGSAVRCCVPLFVMMTGVLLFPVRPAGMGDFYRKRIGRIVVPLLFWSVALPLLFFFHLNYVVTTDNPTVDMQTFTPGMTLTKIYTCIFNFNYDTTPPLVSLHAGRPVSGDSRLRCLAGESFPQGYSSFPESMGHISLPALSEDAGPCAGIHRKLG